MKLLIAAIGTATLGIALMLGGLGVDAWLHAQDPALAEREGIFSLSNPGHALMAAGVALACAGVLGALHIAWGLARPTGVLGARWLRVASMQASVLGAVGAVIVALSLSTAGHSHADAEPALAHTHAESPASEAAAASDAGAEAQAAVDVQPHEHTAASSDDALAAADAAPTRAGTTMMAEPTAHVHAAGPPASSTDGGSPEEMTADEMTAGAPHPHETPAPTDAELACLADLTARTKEATLKYADINVAFADGYVKNTGDPSSTHYPNRAFTLDGAIMDLARPETLIYVADKKTGATVLAGVMFKAAKGQPGPTPCGAATHWHTHTTCTDHATGRRAEGRRG